MADVVAAGIPYPAPSVPPAPRTCPRGRWFFFGRRNPLAGNTLEGRGPVRRYKPERASARVPVIPKELLKPGKFFLPSGPVEFTARNLADYCRSSNRLLDSGRRIPIPLEHRDDALPMSFADTLSGLTLSNTGWVKKFYLKGESLWADLDILDSAAARRVQSGLIPFVSPELRDRFPADGVDYRSVVTHVALTNKPVWKDQQPFHVPSNWLGSDGAVHVPSADLRLSQSGSIRLSLGDAVTESDIQRLSYPYRVPSGGAILFRGIPYEGYVPKKALEEAEAEGDAGRLEVMDLLRKLSARVGRRIARDYAGYQQPHATAPEEPGVPAPAAEVGVRHLNLDHPDLAPLAGVHAGPVLVWEDPADGHLHVVSGHELVRSLQQSAPPDGASPRVAVQVLALPHALEARGAALLSQLMDDAAHPKDLAEFYRDAGLSPAALHDEMRVLARPVSDHVSEVAYRLSRLPDDAWDDYVAGRISDEEADALSREETGHVAEPAAAQAGQGGLENPAQAAIPPERSGDDPPDDPASPVGLAGPAGGEDSAVTDFTSWLTEHLPGHHKAALRLSLADPVKRMAQGVGTMPEPMPNIQETPAGPPKAEGQESEKPVSPEGGGPPSGGEKSVDYFKETLKLLEKFRVPLPPDTTEENFLEHLFRALHVLDAADAGPEPKEAPLQEEQPIAGGVTPMSVANLDKIRALEQTVARLSLERDHASDVASKTEYAGLCREIDLMQADGQVTKAQADEAKETLGKHRLSLVSPNPKADAIIALSKLTVYRQIPKGTYLEKKPVAPVAGAAGATNRLSMETEPNNTKWQEESQEFTQERLEAVKKEFWSTVSIPGLNGNHATK